MIPPHSANAGAVASREALAGLRPPGQKLAHRPKQSDSVWAANLVRHMPGKWQKPILKRFEKTRKQGVDWPSQQQSQVNGNIEIRKTVEALGTVRTGLDASDTDLCEAAERLAWLCFERGQLFSDLGELRAAMERIANGQGIKPPQGKKITDGGAVARMTCPLWWRKKLRRLHGKQVEGTAIQLGFVNRSRQCYVSDQSVTRREQQNRRNAATLENTTATNEHGQTYTLAELAATSPANKRIRRSELMTRISGFERIASDLGHAGLFITITCPSYMHKWSTEAGGGVFENPNYSGVTPRQAQAYLAKKVWPRIRSALDRAGVRIYGIRVAEPNHDGTPHWHLLVFHEPAHLEALQTIVRKYALQDAPNEKGAKEHRVNSKPIDPDKGTAAGYIAKYIAKNIDGHKLESDTYGNPAAQTALRVETWATTWGIRQFQQIGGAPVGPWRELRRVKALDERWPQHLKDAWRATNKIAKIEGRENHCVAWDRYTRAQGGVFCGRRYRIRIATKTVEGLGRYGEPIGERPIGVMTTSTEFWTPAHMEHMGGQIGARCFVVCGVSSSSMDDCEKKV